MIEFISIKGWPNEKWVSWRDRGIGGSEQGGVFGKSDWDDPLKIFLNKIGEPVTTFTGNRFTKFGQLFESHIAELYQYWNENDPDPMAMFANLEKKKKLSQVRSVYAYVVNSKYPWLFASIDRRILRDRRKKGRGILECKNTTSMEKNKYPYAINPAHVLQVYQYLMILEWEYADVAVMVDGNNYDVVTFEPRKDVFESIEYTSAVFWQKVEEAKKIKEEHNVPSYYGMPDYYFTEDRQMEGIAMLQQIEPEITEQTYGWLKEFESPKPMYQELEGTQELWELGVKYHSINADTAKMNGEMNKVKAGIIAELNQLGTEVAIFNDGNSGKISYKPDQSGTKRLYVSPKIIQS